MTEAELLERIRTLPDLSALWRFVDRLGDACRSAGNKVPVTLTDALHARFRELTGRNLDGTTDERKAAA